MGFVRWVVTKKKSNFESKNIQISSQKCENWLKIHYYVSKLTSLWTNPIINRIPNELFNSFSPFFFFLLSRDEKKTFQNI